MWLWHEYLCVVGGGVSRRNRCTSIFSTRGISFLLFATFGFFYFVSVQTADTQDEPNVLLGTRVDVKGLVA